MITGTILYMYRQILLQITVLETVTQIPDLEIQQLRRLSKELKYGYKENYNR